MIKKHGSGRGSGWVVWVLLAGILAVLGRSVRADGLIVISRPVRVVPGHFTFAPLEVSYHKVETTIEDQVATTAVDQEFYNPNNARLEGDYIFPVPKDAQINKFAMDIDGKAVEAELLSADKAGGIYEEIVRKSRDPALLEYTGRAMFRVRIFPIEPNSRKRITLKYTEFLKSDNNLMDYHYTLNTEKYSSRPLKNLSLKINLKCKEAITSLYSPTHDVEIVRHGENEATVGYEAKDVRPDTDFHLYIGRKAGALGLSLLTYRPDAGKPGYFVLLAAPAVKAETKAMPKDVVFVVDTSGSMSGAKIEQAKKALKFCIGTLNPQDRFEIVRFSTEAEPLFKGLRNVDSESRKAALEFAESLKATGGTAIESALTAALAMKPSAKEAGSSDHLFMVVFITDGQPTVGERDPEKILARVKKADEAGRTTRLFTFGVGNDVNAGLLDQLAGQSRAASQYVLPNEDIEVAVSNFFAKVQNPMLANLKLDTGSASLAKLYPAALPDLFKGDQLVVFGTYSTAGHTALTINGTANGTEQKFVQDVNFPESTDHSNEWIAKLWAVRRVGYLLDEIRLHGENAELKEEVTQLARQWGIVTPYTALLIMEDERARGVASKDSLIQDLAKDKDALAANRLTVGNLRQQVMTGAGGVNSAVNLNSYKDMKSLDSFNRAAEQKEERLQLAGKAALAKSVTPPLASMPASAPGAWVDNNNSKGPEQTGYRVITSYAQQNRVVNNRTFYLNSNQWTDATVQKVDVAKAKHVKIEFNSDPYFKLIQDHPETAQWLALGSNVTFELGGTIYDIVETPDPVEATH